jgi:preprotein translocase subunit SecG
MYTLLVIVHVVVALALIVAVLLQSGKGTGLAGAFGGGGGAMGAVFGGRGAATFLGKLTTFLAIAFFVSCLGHSLLTSRRSATGGGRSVIRENLDQQTQQQMETPVPLTPPEGQTTQEGEATPQQTPVPQGADGQ